MKRLQINKLPLILILLLSFLMTSAFEPMHLIRLTVINKAAIDVALRLDNEQLDIHYYLSVPQGDAENPIEKVFTIIPATYSVRAIYLETYDPVYGYPYCGGKSPGGTYKLTMQSRMVIPACKTTFATGGDYGFWKLGMQLAKGHKQFRFLP
ncbi:MAG: hypothetical protein ACPL3P_08325 [Anaerolineales bacterium]